MAIRDKIRENAAPHLRPGEQIQAVFVAQTASQFLILLGLVVFFAANEYFTVIATDQRILVCRSGKLLTTKARSVAAELPRQTRIGPAQGLWYSTESLGRKVRVHKRFHKDIEAADALASGFAGPPPVNPGYQPPA